MSDSTFEPLAARDVTPAHPMHTVGVVLAELVRSADPVVVFSSLVEAYSAAASVFCAAELITSGNRSMIKSDAPADVRTTDKAAGVEDQQVFSLSRRLMTGDGQPLIEGDWLAVPIGATEPEVTVAEPGGGTVGAFICRVDGSFAAEDHAEIARLLVAAATALLRSEQRAVKAEQDVENLQIALRSNRDIGTAMGILMSVHLITQDEAFDVLRRASQHGHRKLRDVAADVIFTGALELLPPRQAPGGTPVTRPRSASY
ncbi:ANTAR domain-containing protein [Jatrophihabitans lederbergiae]|uniref:ANTAR domain-containing protein n=1 Tax=Jatrophihabitans lederbergiae TaxID=3075547 RepID=A0ABU2J6K6_9ACTN|nr:ANTAR domain-containing protein [Jatrophihabitans sp. DSM 44399]MDT0260630.1 ANTAR domain-containing protein [Jatrophihabitans sp. DSM 44399]